MGFRFGGVGSIPFTGSLFVLLQEICLIASDAYQVLELGDQQLLNLIPASRSVTTESVGKLRSACMEFLAACVSWDQFRYTLLP